MASFWEVTLYLLEGFSTTCTVFGLTLVLALPLGLVISFGTMSRFDPVKSIFKTAVWIVRGAPLMLQLFVVYYGVNKLLDICDVSFRLSAFTSTIIAFSLNYACYFSEIYRAGIEAIPAGQAEAGRVLGMTKSEIFSRVTLLQLVKRIVPPMGNEIITLVKDTALANTITLTEIMMNAKTLGNMGMVWPIFYTGVFYLLFVGVLTVFFGRIEKKLSYFKV